MDKALRKQGMNAKITGQKWNSWRLLASYRRILRFSAKAIDFIPWTKSIVTDEGKNLILQNFSIISYKRRTHN